MVFIKILFNTQQYNQYTFIKMRTLLSNLYGRFRQFVSANLHKHMTVKVPYRVYPQIKFSDVVCNESDNYFKYYYKIILRYFIKYFFDIKEEFIVILFNFVINECY